MMSGSKPRRPARSPGEEVDTALMPLFDKLFRCLGAYEDKVDDIAQKIRDLLDTDPAPGRRRSKRSRPPVVEDMQRMPRGDGSLDLSLDGAAVVRLPPLLAVLFEVLVDVKAGRDNVGHVPFKSREYIVDRVNDSGVLTWTFKPSSLAQALSLLRQRLGKAMDAGGDLIEHRRGHGWRIVIRRALAA